MREAGVGEKVKDGEMDHVKEAIKRAESLLARIFKNKKRAKMKTLTTTYVIPFR
jgi:hypothetical protein